MTATEPTTEPLFDHAQLLAEIDQEVRRRRASGELPVGLERDLDNLFARFTPPGATGGDLPAVLERAEQSWFVDVDVPTESRLPLVGHVKRVIRKLMAWYQRYLAQQISNFGHTVVEALQILRRRVETLEDTNAAVSARVAGELERLDQVWGGRLVDEWTDAVVTRLRGRGGRVLHADAGDGRLVAALVAAGLDAYGTSEWIPTGMSEGVVADVDVRPEGPAVHLQRVADGSLAALVLTGCIDRSPLGALVELADLAAAKLAADGVLVVVSANPAAWERAVGTVAADLSAGRPVHPPTWQHLLGPRGFRDVRLDWSRPPAGLDRVPGDDAAATVMNANLARLDEVLFPAGSYFLTAVRERWA
jgi:hypothetical protein